jgi:predicted amidohydrolase
MARSPVIAIAAIKYYDEAKTNNLLKIKEYIAKAKRKGADIVCFPESCIKKTGSVLMSGRFINEIRAECKKNVIWSIITEDVRVGRKTFNTSILIDRSGKIKGHYKKIHLFGDSTSAGNRVKVFKTDFANVGIAICWDLAFPGLFEKMREKGAEIVFCPAQWNYDVPAHENFPKARETALLRAMTLARAHENIFYVALCNPLIKYENQISYSAIADPHRILKELINKEGIITAKVSIGRIRKFRKYYSKE